MHQNDKTSHEVDEKDVGVLQIDNVKDSTNTSIESDSEFTKEEERKIIRKVDFRLITALGILNCVALMDRLNVSAAAIAGMTVELKLNVGYRYSLVILVFFFFYVIAQPFMTVLCRKIGPRPFLSATGLCWGLLMIGFGLAKHWTTLIPLRLILGLCEAGFFPGAIYLISTWYTRFEVQTRYAFFYLIGLVATGCSGILAFGLMHMDGLGGLSGWRWIFIIEGIITFIIGITTYFTLLDFPDQAVKTAKRYLTENEIQFLIRRINRDRDDAAIEPFSLRKWIAPAKDWTVWVVGLIIFCLTTLAYSIAYFMPIILHNNMKFSVGVSQCLVAPPYAFAAILTVLSGRIGDKYRIRGPVLVANATLGLIGLPILGFAESDVARYIGVFLVCGGANASLPTSWAYQSNNIRGQWKRAFCSAVLVGSAGIGGIAGSLVFRAQDAPSYRPGIYASITCNALVIILVSILTIHFKRENRKADTEGKVLEGHPDFRHTI